MTSKPEPLMDLLDRDPLSYTTQDLDRIINELTSKYMAYRHAGSKTAGSKPKLTEKQAAALDAVGDIDLSDL